MSQGRQGGDLDFSRVEELFHQARDLPAEERTAFLERSCGHEPALQDEVEALLWAAEGAEERVAGLVNRAMIDWADGEPEADAPVVANPAEIGPFQVLGRLGRGGQGTVFLAEREGDGFVQRAAVKLLDRGAGHAEARARFRLERRILASLEHPGIARFLDGGTTPDDRLFVALEYVEGQPIDRYCETAGLDLEGRLRLFCRAAEAVEAAHRQLVVHRDLKPSNLLVTPDGEPKLLDFGIAKLLEEVPEGSEPTATHERRLTPGYASPEQLRGERVGVASDVYSLGVLLYRLLTDELPYDRSTSAAIALGAEPPEPARPSTRARNGGRRLAGDLDAIVAKALRADPDERYATVDRLVADIERHLDGRPVEAAQGDTLYRLGKWTRRHRQALAGAAVLLLLLGGLLVFHVDRLRSERDRAVAVEDFLGELLQAAAPEEDQGRERTVRDLAEQAARDLDGFAGTPATHADLAGILGGAFHGLGDYEQARPLLEKAVDLRRQLGSPQELAADLVRLTALLLDQGERDAAMSTATETLAIARSLPRPWDRFFDDAAQKAELLATAASGMAHAHYLARELDQAEALYRESLALRLELFGPDHPDVAESWMGLSAIVYGRGDEALAADYQRRGLEILVRNHGELHMDVAQAMRNLSAVSDDLEEADALAARSIEIQQQLRGGPSLADGIALTNQGFIRRDDGNFSGALEIFQEANRLTVELGGPDHEILARILRGQGEMELALGATEAAERSWQEGLRVAEANFGASQQTARLLHLLGELRLEAGRADEAEPYLREAVSQWSTAGPGDWREADTQGSLGACLAALGHVQEGKALLAASLERLGPVDPEGGSRSAAAERAGRRLAELRR